MSRLSQLSSFLILIALAVTGNLAWAETPDQTPMLTAPATPALAIHGIQPGVGGTQLQLNGATYLLPEGADILWEDGSRAGRNALTTGMRIRIQSHSEGETVVIDQLTILTN